MRVKKNQAQFHEILKQKNLKNLLFGMFYSDSSSFSYEHGKEFYQDTNQMNGAFNLHSTSVLVTDKRDTRHSTWQTTKCIDQTGAVMPYSDLCLFASHFSSRFKIPVFFNILVKSRWIYSPGKDNYINNNFSNPGCYLRSGNTSIFIFFYLEIDEGVLTGSLLTLVLTIIKFRNI